MTDLVCKFSIKTVLNLNKNYCGISPNFQIECNGKEQDRLNCPFWNTMYHVSLTPEQKEE
jgi:hypothetical protein